MRIPVTLPWFLFVILMVAGCQDTTSQSPVDETPAASASNAAAAQSDDQAAVAETTAAGSQVDLPAEESVTVPDNDDPAFSVADVVPPDDDQENDAARRPGLVPGDQAPAIDLAAVVHGPEVRPFSGDHVIVVEFWATWCGPCIRNMPHISDLQQQFGSDVQFIGVTDEDEETVTDFLGRDAGDGETWGEILSYSIALDRNGRTGTSFMEAAAQNAIPCAFVVNRQGKVAWIGHPASIDEPLVQVLNDTWDLDQARQQFLSASAPVETPPTVTSELPSLTPSMPAPPVRLASIVHGPEFDGEFISGKTYVVEFWATWCRPCLSSMPHLNALQKRYGDEVQFIGVTTEDLDTVTEFLSEESGSGNKWGTVLQYSIGVDEDRATSTSYMEAAAQTGIPCAFIVNQSGDVAWIGHPLEIDEPLSQIVDGTYDVELAAELFMAECRLRIAVESHDFDTVLELLADLSQVQPYNVRFHRMQLELLAQLGRWAEFSETAAEIVDANRDHFELLNVIAWEIATSDAGDLRDLDLALTAAMLASEATEHRNSMILDTVARVHYEQGNLEQAVHWQEKAVAAASARRFRRQVKYVLDQYRRELEQAGSSSAAAAAEGTAGTAE